MAELRDRYNSHGFDENGNDKNMNTFEKATKQLVEFSKSFPKEYKRQTEEKAKYDKEFLEDFRSDLKNSMQTSMAKGAAKFVQATVGGAGPIGYILEKTLNLSGATENLINSFGKPRRRTVSSESTALSPNESKKVDKDKFESYPTIVKLRAWLNYQTKDNALFRKYMLQMQSRAKEQAKFEKNQVKEQANYRKIIEGMKKGIDKQTLINTAIAAGVVVGVAALVGLGFWVKDLYNKHFGDTDNTTAEDFGQGIPGEFKSGDYSGQLQVTSGYGSRPAVKDSNGKVIREAGKHYGVDIAGPAGSPVKSLTAGKAYARMQTAKGFREYSVDSKKNKTPLVGYGRFVDVVCLPTTAERLGFPGQTVTIRYAHLKQISFKGQGVRVNKGQIIGTMGSSGTSSGSHVHIEILVDGEKVPPNSIGKQYAYNTKTNSWEKQYTVDPTKVKFFDVEGRQTNAPGAYISNASVDYDKSQAVRTENSNNNKKVNTAPKNPFKNGETSTSGGIYLGGASNIQLSGKNEALMENNNIIYNASRRNKDNTNQSQGYVGSLPVLAQPTTQKEEPKVQLNFDIQNPATKILKQTDRTVDFMKV